MPSFLTGAVCQIVFMGTKLQVVDMIVRFIFVYVIHFRPVSRILQKRLGYQPMDFKHLRFPVLAQRDEKIAHAILLGFQDLRPPRMVVIQAPDTAEIADLVTFKSGYVFPYFVHFHLLSLKIETRPDSPFYSRNRFRR